ncbi:MAG: transcription termination/antitermination NusG family protein [Nocardioidaceae bacterium]
MTGSSIHTYSGMENRVKTNLENRITSLNMEDYIFEVVVPTEEVSEIKNGQRKLVRAYRASRLRPGPDGPHRRVLGGRAPHPVGHRVRRQHPPAGTAQPRRGREHARPGGARRDRGDRCGVGRRAATTTPKVEFADFVVERLRHGRRRSVRHAARNHHRDQRRCRSGSRPLVEIFGRETPVELSFTQIQKV